MIRHIGRIATTTRGDDLGYGFLLALVFEHFGVELQNKVGTQVIDETGSNTLMECGFDLVQGAAQELNRGCKHLLLLFLVALWDCLQLPLFIKNNSKCKGSSPL